MKIPAEGTRMLFGMYALHSAGTDKPTVTKSVTGEFTKNYPA